MYEVLGQAFLDCQILATDSSVCVYVLCLQHRPSTHQLSAKYAAMLPLAAADPNMDSKLKAARMLRTWVHERRAGVQAQMGAAARDAQEGGSTLQDLPEMMVPYGLYILAHHPDFPQVWSYGQHHNSFTLSSSASNSCACDGQTPAHRGCRCSALLVPSMPTGASARPRQCYM
jgi:hypothetical protein